MFMRISIPFDIIEAISKRNQFVSNGEAGYNDRRVAASQHTIRVDGQGSDVKVTVYYIELFNYKETQNLNANIGLGR